MTDACTHEGGVHRPDCPQYPDWVLADYLRIWPMPGDDPRWPPVPPDGYPLSHAAYDEWFQRRRSLSKRKVVVIVCGVCSEPWDLHLDLATTRMAEVTEVYVKATDADVTLEDCVRALKLRNQGPMGPPGPMGAMGMSAR